jgi:hypothetical protein
VLCDVEQKETSMSRRLRNAGATLLAGLLFVTGTGSALAARPEAGSAVDLEANSAVDLETVRADVLERIDARIAGFKARIERLDGRDGFWAVQMVALAQEGIGIFEDARSAVGAAGSVDEIRDAMRAAKDDYRHSKRIRALYAHVQKDIREFGRRLAVLEKAIARAEEAGFDVSAAAEQAREAAADLGTAKRILNGIDPSDPAGEVLQQLRNAHRAAHAAQKHIRAGFWALRRAISV